MFEPGAAVAHVYEANAAVTLGQRDAPVGWLALHPTPPVELDATALWSARDPERRNRHT